MLSEENEKNAHARQPGLRVAVVTIFPEIFSSFLEASLIKKSRESGLLEIELIQLREFAQPPHHQVDDSPYGGGAGMVMKVEPLVEAVRKAQVILPGARVILLSPSATLLSQTKVQNFSEGGRLILICGRYEGVDQRFIDSCVDEEVSIGDYILMGGEVAAMVVIESVTRLIPGVLGNQASLRHESFSIQQHSSPLLEGPQYTRPAEFEGRRVPEVLLSGNHQEIEAWRHEKAIEKTKRVRPDLLRFNCE